MARKIMSTGVGESKQFNAPSADQEARPQRHVNGVPVEDTPMGHLLASTYSDEELAERAKLPKARTSVVADEFDRGVIKQYDDSQRAAKPWMSTNPMKAMADKFVPAGHTGRFLGERKVQVDGLRGWEPVKNANGDPVKLGNMVLGSMPIGEAKERNDHFRGLDAQRISQIRDGATEQAAQLAHAKGMRVAPGESGFRRAVGNTAAFED
jgi:hypothetical protein